MKKLIAILQIGLPFLFLMLAFSHFLNGQNYKVKKGRLFKDKQEVGRIEGEIGVLKLADLIFYNINDEEALKVKEHWLESDYPIFEPVRWYVLTFTKQFEEVVFPSNGYFKEKTFIKYVLKDQGVEIYKEGFKWEELSKIRENDYKEKLKKDTVEIAKEVRFYQEVLSAGRLERDFSKRPTIRPIPTVPDMYWINQGFDLKSEPYEIGRLGVFTTAVLGEPEKREIMILKRLPEPVMRDGEEVEFIEAGYVDLSEVIPKLFTFQDGVVHKQFLINQRDPVEAIYSRLIDYMIAQSYL